MATSITVIVTFGWKVTRVVRALKASFDEFKKQWAEHGKEIADIKKLATSVDARLARLVALHRAERDLEGSCTFEATESGSVVHVSHGWTRLTGCAIDEARGSGWLSCIHPESRDDVRDGWRLALASGEPFDMEFYIEHGSKVRGRAKPLYEGGTIVGWAGLWERTEPDYLDDSHPNMTRVRPLV